MSLLPRIRLLGGRPQPPLDFELPADDGDVFRFDAELRERHPCVLVWYRGHWCTYCKKQARDYQDRLDGFRDLGVLVAFISADPPAKSAEFRRRLGLEFPLLSDEHHVTARHYGIAISHVDPRAWSYPDGFNQPAVFGYVGDREVFRWIQKPSFLNAYGAVRRPEPEKVLARMRRELSSR